jgi:hypothetical protein
VPTALERTGDLTDLGVTLNDLAADVYPSFVNQMNTLPPNQFFLFQFVTTPVPLYTPSFGTAPPAVVFPTIPSNGMLLLANGIGVSYIPANQQIPHVDSWNFTVEREVGHDITASVVR